MASSSDQPEGLPSPSDSTVNASPSPEVEQEQNEEEAEEEQSQEEAESEQENNQEEEEEHNEEGEEENFGGEEELHGLEEGEISVHNVPDDQPQEAETALGSKDGAGSEESEGVTYPPNEEINAVREALQKLREESANVNLLPLKRSSVGSADVGEEQSLSESEKKRKMEEDKDKNQEVFSPKTQDSCTSMEKQNEKKDEDKDPGKGKSVV